MKKYLSLIIECLANIADIYHTKRLKRFYETKEINTVIDVGSHKGEFINRVCNDKVTIYSFEPQSTVRDILIKNTQHRNVVEYYDYALSHYEGTIDLFCNHLTSTTSTRRPNYNNPWIGFKRLILGGDIVSGKTKVKVTTLDEVFDGKLIDRGVILLKIDVEGAEADVLKGGMKIISECDIAYIQVESANYRIYSTADSHDPKNILFNYGYRVEKSFLFPLLNFSDIVYSKY